MNLQGVESISVTSQLSFNNKFLTQLPISLMRSGDAPWGMAVNLSKIPSFGTHIKTDLMY